MDDRRNLNRMQTILDSNFKLHPTLEADSVFVTSLALCDVRLVNDGRYLWCLLVPRLSNLRDLHDVPNQHKADMQSEIDRVSLSLNQLASAHKMNVASLGNVVEQLHVHVIARHETDVAWPGPVWGVGIAEPYSNERLQALVSSIQRQLTA